MIGRRFSETRRMPSRRFREAEEHEYTFLLCLSCNAFKYKNDVFTEKTIKAENLAGAVDKLAATLSRIIRDNHEIDGTFEDFKDYVETPLTTAYDLNSEDDFADYIISSSIDGDMDPCYLGIMKDGEIIEEDLYQYMEGYDPYYQVIYWRSIIQKIKKGTLNLDKWGHSLHSVEWKLEDARDSAREY